MIKPIIAVDIDGVLADWVGSAVPRLNKILDTTLDVNGNVSFDLHKAFGVDKKTMHEALDKLYENFSVDECKRVSGAKGAIVKLSRDFDIIAITARPKEFWKQTYDWVKDNFDGVIELYFGTAQGKPFGADQHKFDKLVICKRFNASYLIEDNPAEIIEALKSNTKPLCIAWPWNNEISKNIEVPRGDWKFITQYIEENEKKKTSN